MSFYFALIKALPFIIERLKAYEAAQAEGKVEEKLQADVKEIHSAFATKDATKLRALFNSK